MANCPDREGFPLLPAVPGDVYREVVREIQAMQEDLVLWRRWMHQSPELAFQEVLTAEFIARKLEDFGLTRILRQVGATGVVGVIEGVRPGDVVAVRADMDALPIQEIGGRSYGSRVNGQMHACGHDAHCAIALGTAGVLSRLRGLWPGTVKFLFQPAEEGSQDGGVSGACRMIEDGALEDPEPQVIYALHVMPSLEVGKFGCNRSAVWAGAERFLIHILGKKTHGAYPHTGVDPIPVAAEIILALQTIVSRQMDPRFPSVITVGEIHGGNRDNIITDCVRLHGTVRSLKVGGCEEIRQRMTSLVERIAAAHGARAQLEFFPYAGVTMNHPSLAGRAAENLRSLFGLENVVDLPPQLGSEDFSHFLEKIPGVYFLLGVANPEKGIQSMLHSESFDLDEDALLLGVKAMTCLVLDRLFQR